MVGTTSDMPTFDPCAYEPPVSLWRLIEQNSPAHERLEIKQVLGESMVDQSLELHEEVDLLLEIWHDYRCETFTETYHKRLPEPPEVRDRLKKEIKFFVENLRERASRQGVDPNKVFDSHNKDILDYAIERADKPSTPSRPSTAVSRQGRETPMVISPASDRMSLASTVSEEVESMNDKLNILEVDEVIQRLRSTLEDEVSQLKSDIHFLQGCLDDEATFRDESSGGHFKEPSITELREERASLEKQVLKSDVPLPSFPECMTKPDLPSQLRKYAPLPRGGNNRPKEGGVVVGSSKTSPVKAAHHLSPPANQTSENKDPSVPQGRHSACVRSDNSNLPTRPSVRLTSAASISTRPSVRQTSAGLGGTVKILSSGSARAQVVQITSMTETNCDGDSAALLPSPPHSSKPRMVRPNSADRFRKMVLQSRDG